MLKPAAEGVEVQLASPAAITPVPERGEDPSSDVIVNWIDPVGAATDTPVIFISKTTGDPATLGTLLAGTEASVTDGAILLTTCVSGA
jgi:hypothetical protein